MMVLAQAIWVRVRHFAWCVGRGWAFAGVALFSLSEVDSFGGPAGLAAPAGIGLLHPRWSTPGIGTSVVDGMVRAMPPEPVVQWLAGATRLLLKKVDALEKQVLNLNRANDSTSTGFAWNVHAAPFLTKAMDPPFAVEVNEVSYEEFDELPSATQEGLAIMDDDEEKQPGELQAAQNPDEEEEAESECEWTTKGNEIEKAKKEQGVTHETQESKQREDHYDIFMQEIELLNALRIRCFSGDECEQKLRAAESYNISGSSGHKKQLHDPVGKAPANLQDPTQPVHQENLTNSNIQTEVSVRSFFPLQASERQLNNWVMAAGDLIPAGISQLRWWELTVPVLRQAQNKARRDALAEEEWQSFVSDLFEDFLRDLAQAGAAGAGVREDLLKRWVCGDADLECGQEPKEVDEASLSKNLDETNTEDRQGDTPSPQLVGKIGLLAERLMIETGTCHGIGNSFLWDTIDRCCAQIFERTEVVEVCHHELVQQVIAQLVLQALCMMRDAHPSGFRAVTQDAYESTLHLTCSNVVQFIMSEQFQAQYQATVRGAAASLHADDAVCDGSSSCDCNRAERKK